MRILYDSKKEEYKSPFGALRLGQKCTITVRIPAACRTREVYLCFENDNTADTFRLNMELTGEKDSYQSYTARFTLGKTGLYFYYFFVSTQESEFELYRCGYADTNIAEGEKWQLTCYPADFSVPESFVGKVMYQIFPDRFYREYTEDAADKLTPFYIHECTDDVPDYLPNDKGEILNCDFFWRQS